MGIKKMPSSGFSDSTIGKGTGQRHSDVGHENVAKVQYSFSSSI